tara:strand:+ start:2471 stop:2833 length:363 start_codon:yes stop_codon:yes gene_type:complete
MINKIILMGKITTSPESTTTSNNLLIAKMTIVSSDSNGKETKIPVKCFGKTAEIALSLNYNDIVLVEGKLDNNIYTNPSSGVSYDNCSVIGYTVRKIGSNQPNQSSQPNQSNEVKEIIPF